AARATGSGWAPNSFKTESGIQISENCDLRKARRSITARFERGEVLLTARIVEILSQLVFRVVPRNVALGDKVGKGETRRFRELAGLAKRENPTSIESDRKL